MRIQNQSASSAESGFKNNTSSGDILKITERVADSNPLLWSLSSAKERDQLVADQQFDDLITNKLATAARSEEGFNTLLKDSFGTQFDSQSANELRTVILNGNKQSLPRLEIVDPGQLSGVMGAYSQSNDTIYLSTDIVGTELGEQTLIEEFGHAIDARINRVDSRGDEGELFRRTLNGESINVDQYQRINTENDHGTLTINGQSVAVEFRQDGGYTGPDYPWNPDGVASGSANKNVSGSTNSGGYAGPDYPWNPGGVATGGSANQTSADSEPSTPVSVRAIEQRAEASRERAQSLANDIDALGTSGGYVTDTLREELLNELTVMEGDNRDTALQVRAFMEQGHSLGEAQLRSRVVQELADEPIDIDGGFGAAGIGPGMPRFSNVIDGAHGTSADAALAILNDMNAGNPAFRPEMGQRGPVQWFVTNGDPRTGRASAQVTIPAEIQVPRGATVMEFNDVQLQEIFDDLLPEAREVVTAQYARQYPDRDPTSRRSLSDIEFRARGLAEGNMWTEVGERVAASDSGIGRVVQSADSLFSTGQAGTFMLTSKPELATVRGGSGALLEIIQRNGIRAEPAIVEAAERASRSGAITGNIDGVFRVGGRVLVVAGIAADGYRIYQADDRIRETVIVGGGWGGAASAMAAYNTVTGPSNAGGPWFWAGNLVGNVVVGVGGYYAGEKIAELVYDLAVSPEPIEVPAE